MTKIDVTEIFGSDIPEAVYENSKDYLESLETEDLLEVLILVRDYDNKDDSHLLDIVELNYRLDGHDINLKTLDAWQFNGLRSEVEQVFLNRVSNEYEKSKEVKEKIVRIYD